MQYFKEVTVALLKHNPNLVFQLPSVITQSLLRALTRNLIKNNLTYAIFPLEPSPYIHKTAFTISFSMHLL